MTEELHCLRGWCAFGRQAVPGTGRPDAEVLIIGEAPGARELREGVPFVGPAGSLLNSLLQEAGLSRDEVYITNSCSCVALSREERRPLPAELAACRPRLEEEIATVNPRVVLLIGATALSVFFPGYRIGEVYNTWRAVEGRIIVPTYHTAHILRSGTGHKAQLHAIILEALRRAKRLVA